MPREIPVRHGSATRLPGQCGSRCPAPGAGGEVRRPQGEGEARLAGPEEQGPGPKRAEEQTGDAPG